MNTKRLIFTHIPKTAGTSVRFHLKDALSEAFETYTEVGVYDMRGWPKPIPGGCAPNQFHSHDVPENWHFLYGHVTIQQILSNPAITAVDDNIVLLCFVRDPIERLVSEYNYIATTLSHPLHMECIETPAIEFLERIGRQTQNMLFNYLNCTKNSKWKFIVAPNTMVPQACKLAFELTTGQEIAEQRFSKRFNVTKDFKEIGRASKLCVADLTVEHLSVMRELNNLDVFLFDLVKSHGIMQTNPAWRV